MNLITAEEQVPVSFAGDERWGRPVSHTRSYCIRVVESGEPLVIEDAAADERVRDHPGTVEGGIGSYLAVPLRSHEGYVLGTLCVVAFEARKWDPESVRILEELADEIVRLVLAHQEVLRRSADRLRETEETFRHFAENLPSVLWKYDAAFSRALYVSRAYETVWKRPLTSIRADPRAFLQSVHPDDLDIVHGAMKRMGEGRTARVEYRILRPDGSVGWLISRGSPVRDGNGEVSQVVGTTDDVTERKDAECRLRAAEAHYRRLVEHAPYTIFALDREGRFTELSRAATDALGFPPEQLIGKTLADLVIPEDLPAVEHSLRKGLAGEVETTDLEFRVVHASGSPRLLHSRSTAIIEGGEVVGIHGIARDITAERARSEDRRLLAAALENLDEGVIIARFDGAIIYANAAHARLLGYDPAQRPLPSVQELTARKEMARLDRIVRIVAERGVWSGRVRHRRLSDGHVLPMELILGRIDREEGQSLLFSIARDVSEEIERERHLRRTERLASVGTLIGGVAHELNNPLHAIQSFAEFLADEAEGKRIREDLLTIQREAVRAARIVSDLRLLARETQEEGKRAPVDLNGIVRHVLTTRRYALETRNIEIRTSLASAIPPVLADQGQLEQVVLNLIVNAEQAMEGQRDDRRLTVRTGTGRAGATLHVEDSGAGIPAEQVDRIFDPFWTTKPAGVGTGLGLSLVHSIVTEHGGEIHVESEPGTGTTFRVELPGTAALPTRTGGDAAGPDAPEEALRILLVDDEPAIRRVLTRYLARRGHRIDTASEGAEALRLLQAAAREEEDYDVVVSDLRMPGLGGEELYARLEAEGRGMERRIVFITGDAAGGDAARILGCVDSPVLYKPMRLAEAAQRIERHAADLQGG